MRFAICYALLITMMSPVRAATIEFGDFSDVSALALNGAASEVFDSGRSVLRLTGTSGQIAGSAYLANPVALGSDGSFSTAFQFRMSNATGSDDPDGPGADGLAFVVQTTSSTFLGTGGGYLGYGGGVLPNSLAVEFDTYRNTGWATDIDGNHVAVNLNGDVTHSYAMQSVSPLMNTGSVWSVWVDYNGSADLLEVRLSDAATRPLDALLLYSVDLLSLTNSADVFFGFSAGIAGGQQNHDILNWALTNSYAPFGVAVPEPGTFALLIIGLAGLSWQRRREVN